MIDISEVDAVPFNGFGSVNRVKLGLDGVLRFGLGSIRIGPPNLVMLVFGLMSHPTDEPKSFSFKNPSAIDLLSIETFQSMRI